MSNYQYGYLLLFSASFEEESGEESGKDWDELEEEARKGNSIK